jgi:hypothetical protein
MSTHGGCDRIPSTTTGSGLPDSFRRSAGPREAPAAHANPRHLKFAFASCQDFQAGYYTAYAHLAQEDLAFCGSSATTSTRGRATRARSGSTRGRRDPAGPFAADPFRLSGSADRPRAGTLAGRRATAQRRPVEPAGQPGDVGAERPPSRLGAGLRLRRPPYGPRPVSPSRPGGRESPRSPSYPQVE